MDKMVKKLLLTFIVLFSVVSVMASVGSYAEEQTSPSVIFPQDVVAFINEVPVTDIELKQYVRSKYGRSEKITMEHINSSLDALIRKHLMTMESYRMGLNEDPIILEDRKNYIRIQSIIRLRVEFITEVTVSEEEVIKAIKDDHAKIEAELLYFKDEEKAKRVFALVQEGKKIENLKDEGEYWAGQISKKTYGKTSPVTEAVFAADAGETIYVSSDKGFIIFKVLEKVAVSQEVIDKLAPNIKQKIRTDKADEAKDAFYRKEREKAIIKINDELLKNLKSEELLDNGSWKDDSRIIVTINDEDITVSTFLRKYQSYLKPHAPLSISTQEEKNENAMGIVINITIESQAALARNYYESSPTLKEDARKHRERAMRNYFFNTTILPIIDKNDENLERYYRDNIKDYLNPSKVALKGILVRDELKAKKLLKELRKGANITFLAKKFSLQHSYNGWKLITEYPKPIAKNVRQLDVGDYSGIINIDNAFLIVKLVGREEGEPRSFLSVRENVKRRYVREEGKKLLEEVTDKLKANSDIRINTSLLNDLEKALTK